MWDLFHHPLTTDERYAIFLFTLLVGIVGLVAIRMLLAYLRESRDAAYVVTLKRDMLQRGMSAAEIERVLAAKAQPEQPNEPTMASHVGRAAGDLVRRVVE